jgi:hypothetical protein
MAERIQSIRIVVEIDTNKDTYSEEFDDMREAIAWWNAQADDLGLDPVPLPDAPEEP